MNIQTLTPAAAALFTFRITQGKADPETVAGSFRRGAEEWREIARKATASDSGKFKGCTAEKALSVAADLDSRAVSVPAELRRLQEAAK